MIRRPLNKGRLFGISDRAQNDNNQKPLQDIEDIAVSDVSDNEKIIRFPEWGNLPPAA
jgi:hypothetical protein